MSFGRIADIRHETPPNAASGIGQCAPFYRHLFACDPNCFVFPAVSAQVFAQLAHGVDEVTSGTWPASA